MVASVASWRAFPRNFLQTNSEVLTRLDKLEWRLLVSLNSNLLSPTDLARLYSVHGELAQRMSKEYPGSQSNSVVRANSRMSTMCVAELVGEESTVTISIVTCIRV